MDAWLLANSIHFWQAERVWLKFNQACPWNRHYNCHRLLSKMMSSLVEWYYYLHDEQMALLSPAGAVGHLLISDAVYFFTCNFAWAEPLNWVVLLCNSMMLFSTEAAVEKSPCCFLLHFRSTQAHIHISLQLQPTDAICWRAISGARTTFGVSIKRICARLAICWSVWHHLRWYQRAKPKSDRKRIDRLLGAFYAPLIKVVLEN